MAKRELTVRMKRFVIEFLRNGGNATAAFKESYACEKWTKDAIYTESARVRHLPQVADAIDTGMRKIESRQTRILDPRKETRQIVISRESAIEELARIGFSNIMDYVRIGDENIVEMDLTRMTRDQAAAITEITVNFTGRGEKRIASSVKIKLGDKQAALMNLAKLLGWAEAEDDKPQDSEKARALKSEIFEALRSISTPAARQGQKVIDVVDGKL